MAFRYSARRGLCEARHVERVEAAVAESGLPTRLVQAGVFSADALLGRMAGDKKAAGGAMRMILARGIGAAFLTSDIDKAALRATLQESMA